MNSSETVQWVLFGIMFLGIMLFNSVNLAVVVNYVTQCEMILFYVRGIALRLQEKSTDMRTAMKVGGIYFFNHTSFLHNY